MQAPDQNIITHLMAEQPIVEARSAIADTFAGRIDVEWDATAPVMPFGQLPFFIDYLKQAGLFDAWVADCPLSLTSPNAPSQRECAQPARPAWHSDAVRAGRTSPLRAHHCAAL